MSQTTKRIFMALWVLAACAGLYAWWQSDIPLTQLPAALRDVIEEAGPWGPFVYVLLFVFRALTLAPASPFVLAAGLAWGPWKGMFWAWIGINLSGWAAYWVARAMGREWVAKHETPWMAKMEAKLVAKPMMTSLLLRLLLLPFDTVNYACGLVGIPFLPYIAGTALGVLPGVVTFALFGGAFDDPRAIAVSVAVFGASLAGAAVLKRRGLIG